MNIRKKSTKVSVIGAGFVGSTTAYALMQTDLVSDLVIVDINKTKAEGEAMDLAHGTSFVKPINIMAGDYKDTKDSDIVVITAGAGQKPGETRLDLINKNLNIFKSIIPEVVKYSPESILLVVSNPVDVLTYITYKLSGFPKERVIGSGTVLDTSRFRYLISKKFDIDARNIHTYIMGEHGDSEIATWSSTNIAGMSLDEFCSNLNESCDANFKKETLESVKKAAYEIIKKKGYTNYAVGLAVTRIVSAILGDENAILTVSSLLKGQYGINDVYLGTPTIINRHGVEKVLEVPLDKNEMKELKDSAEVLKGHIEKSNIE